MKYRLVIFDSDGTLADTLPWMRNAFNELADEHGFRRIEAHEHEQFRDLHGTELLGAVGLPLWKVPYVMRDMRKRMAEYTGEFAVFPGIPEALHRLSASGIQLAIVSSNSKENVARILGPGNARLIRYWDCGASLFGKRRKIRSVVRASTIPAEEAIYIGDEVRDAEAARAAGVAFGAVAWGQHSPGSLHAQNPSEFFEKASDIADQLAAL